MGFEISGMMTIRRLSQMIIIIHNPAFLSFSCVVPSNYATNNSARMIDLPWNTKFFLRSDRFY